MNALRVLLTNRALSDRTGTEIVIRDLALGLLRRGHHPYVYAHEIGAFAAEVRGASIPVVDEIDAIGTTPDVIHGHHNSALAAAVARFPDVSAIFVCHDFTAWHDAPPIFPSIRRYVAVDRTVADRLVIESGIPPERVAVHLNAVDLERFSIRNRELPARPRRALAYVKHTAHLEELRAACSSRGIALEVAGTVAGKPLAAPERVLRDYDLVFTSALAAGVVAPGAPGLHAPNRRNVEIASARWPCCVRRFSDISRSASPFSLRVHRAPVAFHSERAWRKLLNYKIGPLPLPLYLAISLITIAAALNKKLPNDMIGGFAVLMLMGFLLGEIGSKVPVLKSIASLPSPKRVCSSGHDG